MPTVTFLVLEGVDKGRVFRDLSIPVTIGREEGNGLRLNDERISRYHAKVQHEDGDIIITDLESTNGTRVNGTTVQIRRLRPGDQVSVGRSMLLFGTMEEIALRRGTPQVKSMSQAVHTLRAEELAAGMGASGKISSDDAHRHINDCGSTTDWSPRDADIPPLPMKLSGSQSARISEVFDYLHRGLTIATENIESNEDGTEVRLGFDEWQTIVAVQMLLARYVRMVAEPDQR